MAHMALESRDSAATIQPHPPLQPQIQLHTPHTTCALCRYANMNSILLSHLQYYMAVGIHCCGFELPRDIHHGLSMHPLTVSAQACTYLAIIGLTSDSYHTARCLVYVDLCNGRYSYSCKYFVHAFHDPPCQIPTGNGAQCSLVPGCGPLSGGE